MTFAEALPTAPRELVLVRHASTAWSRSGKHTGRTDIALDDEGIVAARELTGRLAHLAAAAVYASPLRRATDTCELSGLGSHVEFCDDLMEWDYGDYEGRTTEEIQRDRPGWMLFRDGCPRGERAVDVGARADHFLDELARRGDAVVVAFAHGHLLRVLGARWLGLDPAGGQLLALNAPSVSDLGVEHAVRVIHRWNT